LIAASSLKMTVGEVISVFRETKMKAIRVREFGGPEVMRVEDVPDPKPSKGEVVVRIHAAGVNPVDAYIRTGTYARKPPLPYTPGSDGGGVVEAVGEGVERFRAADRVYVNQSTTGTYAQMAVCPESGVHPLPEKVSYAQGAAMGVPYATAYRALFQRAHVQSGETVFIHGASGGVGIAAVQMARAAGMRVIGTAGSDRGRELVSKEGAHESLDHKSANYLEKVKALTGGQGPDVILEMLANKNLANDLGVLAMRGRVVVIGNRGTIEINPRDAMARDAAILGMTLFNVNEQDMAEIHQALVGWLKAGTIDPVIGKEFPLSDAPRAHQAVMESGAYGKIVLLP
jgi:NADPH2:quinone reductase